jgi:hypothetical protein
LVFFDKGSTGYDFGILILKADFRLNEKVQVAKLPPIGNSCPFGETLIASGWGKERKGSGIGLDLIYHRYVWAVKQKCIDVDKCTRYVGDKDAVICAGGLTDDRDTACYLDSGGNCLFVYRKCIS